MVEPRYAKNITFDAQPVALVAENVAGGAGLAGATSPSKSDKEPRKDDPKKEEPKKEEPKKKGGLFGKVGLTSGAQSQNTQTVASAGARGGVPDRDAKGGPDKTRVVVTVSAAELEAFKKGIA